MDIKLPRILSPNLGCPIIVSLPDLRQDGIDVVIAEPIDAAPSVYSIAAIPSSGGAGHEFNLVLEARQELTDPALPRAFDRVEQTRWHISTTLRASIFAGKARFVRFSASPATKLTKRQLRTTSDGPRITLYDLVLKGGAEELFTVFHALALRPAEGMLRFIHATDLHVALRNDLYDASLKIGEQDADASSPIPFVNFNKNLRRFIQYANDLADDGKLDFVLLLGDLVDFKEHNYSDRDDYGENNWKLLCDIFTGAEAKGGQGGKTPGIKVPVFTSTGNHDWRFFPYPPKDNAAAYGLDKKSAKGLDPFWADDPEKLTQATKGFYQKMIGAGALLSNVMLGGKFLHDVGELVPKLRDTLRGLVFRNGKVRGNPLDWLLPRMATWKVQVLAPLATSGLVASGAKWPLLSKLIPFLKHLTTSPPSPLEVFSIVIAGVSGAINGVIGFVKFLVRWKSPDLMALEAGWQALRDYFLNLNPYFNYAFRVEKNYFLILDTGFDCIRTQRFWDDGRKKLGPIGIKSGILGGSPDSMGFYGANEFYPYSQIAWMEGLLRLISHGEGIVDGPARIFVGVHAPPINLSKKERSKADHALQGQQEIPLEPGKYNIRYGSINHYLSQFLHLCLGRAEGRLEDRSRPVTMVFAGHAHWRLECCLRWDSQVSQPRVFYGNYTGKPGAWQDCLNKSRPLILQTPAIGPIGDDPVFKSPPHFRWIEIDKSGAVLQAEVASI
ncbi:MAG: metallophosphoesterase [Desulfobaccales bacterium]